MTRWSVEQASQWYAQQPWLVGCNFLPSTAINQLEMFQADSYDPETIEKELTWAEEVGFNTLRVYLHDLLWLNDKEGFCQRLDDFLSIAERHGMKILLVLFDDCHRPDPVAGTQTLPVRGVHNSGWVMSPGAELTNAFHDGTVDEGERTRLREYVIGVLTHFKDDPRILMWDLYNEPGNQGNRLLLETWAWAESVRPSQPMTACAEGCMSPANYMTNLAHSDIITFHNYDAECLERTIAQHQAISPGRPLICTEYMAREFGTTFQFSLPIFKAQNVGCYNWGFVAGKSQTHFNWQTVQQLEELREAGDFVQPGEAFPEPELWFHDIYRVDGTPFSQDEVDFIKSITQA
jgi:hypothetical protein